MTFDPPDGRRGQALAVALTLVLLASVLFGAVLPAMTVYDEREEAIATQRERVEHMSRVADDLPRLRHEAEQAASEPAPPASLMEGDSDAVAAARLQETVQGLAADSGCTIASLETLPGETVDPYRRVSLHVALSAPYSALVGLLGAMEGAEPRLFIDDLRLQGPLLTNGAAEAPMDASFTVIAFRAAGGPTR